MVFGNDCAMSCAMDLKAAWRSTRREEAAFALNIVGEVIRETGGQA